jgi:small subunit ribosomal protein S11
MSEDNIKKDKKVEDQEKSVPKESVVKKTEVADGEGSTTVVKKKRKNIRRQVRKGRVYIKSSYNNTLVMFTDMHGNSLAWSSAGLLGFKGAKKATTYAANQVAMDAHEKIQKYGLKDIEVFIKGVGSGRDAALRALAQKGYNLIGIKDKTPVPHNGCRPKKPRRV